MHLCLCLCLHVRIHVYHPYVNICIHSSCTTLAKNTKPITKEPGVGPSAATGCHGKFWRQALEEVQTYSELEGTALPEVQKLLSALPAAALLLSPSSQDADSSGPNSRSVSPVEVRPRPSSRSSSPLPTTATAATSGSAAVSQRSKTPIPSEAKKHTTSGSVSSKPAPPSTTSKLPSAVEPAVMATSVGAMAAEHSGSAETAVSAAATTTKSGSAAAVAEKPASTQELDTSAPAYRHSVSSGKAGRTTPEQAVFSESEGDDDEFAEDSGQWLFNYENADDRVEDVVLVVSDLSAPCSPASNTSSPEQSKGGKGGSPHSTRSGLKRGRSALEQVTPPRGDAGTASKAGNCAAAPGASASAIAACDSPVSQAKRRKDIPALAAMDVLPSVTELAPDDCLAPTASSASSTPSADCTDDGDDAVPTVLLHLSPTTTVDGTEEAMDTAEQQNTSQASTDSMQHAHVATAATANTAVLAAVTSLARSLSFDAAASSDTTPVTTATISGSSTGSASTSTSVGFSISTSSYGAVATPAAQSTAGAATAAATTTAERQPAVAAAAAGFWNMLCNYDTGMSGTPEGFVSRMKCRSALAVWGRTSGPSRHKVRQCWLGIGEYSACCSCSGGGGGGCGHCPSSVHLCCCCRRCCWVPCGSGASACL
eukprot:scpid66366/ scgid16748/ 